jgi:hypothetical protein
MMDDFNILKQLARVAAPANFESRVLAELGHRRRIAPQVRRAQIFKFAISGAAAGLLITFAVLNLFVFNRSTGSQPGLLAIAQDPIQVTESVNYGREVRAASTDPRTIYLLERVSDVSNVLIRY